MATLTSSWQEIYRTSKNTGYGNQYVIFYAYATENIADNTSTVHTLIRTTVEGSGNYVSVSSWSAASDTQSTSGGSTSWGEGDHDLLESAWEVSHNADGTGSVSIGFLFDATYNITHADHRETVGLQQIPRYASVSQSVASASETSIQIKFSASAECDGMWYSLNGGDWQGTGVYPHTGGYYTISGLSANTTYSIKTRVKRTDSQLYSETSAISASTYDYPHATSCPAYTIANQTTTPLYNPLSRSCTVIMFNTNWGEVKRITTNNTGANFNSAEFADALYASIPNADHGTYVIRVVYGSSSRDEYGTYYVNTNVCYPSVSGLTYVDTNSKTLAITGDASKIVQNISTPNYTMTASARYHASLSSAVLKVNGATYTCTISGNTISVQGGVINSGSDVNATCQVTDSRGITATMGVNVTMLAWSNPTAINTVHRHNNFYSETDITCDASFSQIGSNTLTIGYTATSQNGTVISGSLSDNVMITKTLDNNQSWTIAISLADTLGGKTTYSIPLQRGQPILFIDDRLESISVGMFPTGTHTIEAANLMPYNNAGSHNGVFRGKDITANVTDGSFYTNIKNGTFNDIYIGDYFKKTVNGTVFVFRVAGLDVYLHRGSTEFTSHHAVIVPDGIFGKFQMNSSNTTAGGYVATAMYTNVLPTWAGYLATAFGSNLLTNKELLSNAISGDLPSGWDWYDSKVNLMTSEEVVGHGGFGMSGYNYGYNIGIAYGQLPLFRLAPEFICNREIWWLRNITTAADFALVYIYGYLASSDASNTGGLRPRFLLG